MALACPSCRVPFRPEDLNLERALAKCASCSSVMELGGTSAAPGRVLRQRVPIPERFKDFEEPGRYVISWRWFRPQLFFMLFFCIAWDSFLLFWYGTAFAADRTEWLQVVFPIAHVAVGIGLTYSTIAGFFNRTTIETTRSHVRVRHGPLPWPGKELEVGSIAQLYCEAHVVTNDGSTTTYYDVSAVLKDGSKQKLLKKLTELDQALFIEQRLESAMKIPDARVPGEVEAA